MQNVQPSEGALANAWHSAGAAVALTNTAALSTTAAALDTGGKTSVTAECNLSVPGAIAIVYVVAQVSIDGGTTWMQAQTELVNAPADGDVSLAPARFRKPVTVAEIWPVTFKTPGCTHYRFLAYGNVGDVASRFTIRTKDCGLE